MDRILKGLIFCLVCLGQAQAQQFLQAGMGASLGVAPVKLQGYHLISTPFSDDEPYASDILEHLDETSAALRFGYHVSISMTFLKGNKINAGLLFSPGGGIQASPGYYTKDMFSTGFISLPAYVWIGYSLGYIPFRLMAGYQVNLPSPATRYPVFRLDMPLGGHYSLFFSGSLAGQRYYHEFSDGTTEPAIIFREYNLGYTLHF